MTAEPVSTPLGFVKSRPGVEAAITRIGLHSAQLILIAEDGEWLRYVVPSVEAAEKAAKRLKLEHHMGIPDHLKQRMTNYRRSSEDWAGAPYPERTRGTST